MVTIRSQIVFPFFTNLPTDVIVNQMHWESDVGATQATADLIALRLRAFYDTIYGTSATSRVNYIDWPLVRVKVFNMQDPPPRVPAIGNPLFAAGTGTSTVPTEVAAVMSYHAAPESGVRFQRLYNRIYIGGLRETAFTPSAVDGFPIFSSAFTTAVGTAAANLLAANTAGLLWRQASDASPGIFLRPITGGWVDNSPDTQRRRSVGASLRDIWP